MLDREDSPLVRATLRTPRVAHDILAVEHKEAPSSTSYGRVILSASNRAVN